MVSKKAPWSRSLRWLRKALWRLFETTTRCTGAPLLATLRPMAAQKDHLIGLLLGAEEDWPQAFEQILRFVGPLDVDGTSTGSPASD